MNKRVYLLISCIAAMGLASCAGEASSSSADGGGTVGESSTKTSESTQSESTDTTPAGGEDTDSSTELVGGEDTDTTPVGEDSEPDDEPDALLEEAIAAMGHNYTANVYYGDALTYRHLCTEDGIYKDYFDEWRSSGFMFGEDGLAYFFELQDGEMVLDDEPYLDFYDEPYTKEYVISRDYQVSYLHAEDFVKTAPNTYLAKEEKLYELSHGLVDAGLPAGITLLTENGKVKSVSIEDFVDEDSGMLDTATIEFVDVGTTMLDFSKPEKPDFVSQLPAENDPTKPVAPEEYDLENYHEPDPYDAGESEGGELGDALFALKSNAAYAMEDYFEDTVNKGTDYWEPSSAEYEFSFKGSEAYIENAYSGVSNYLVKSGDEAYRVDIHGHTYAFVKRDFSFEDATLGGNVFARLRADMFEESSAGVYKAKQSALAELDQMMAYCARGKDSFYGGDPDTYVKQATIALEGGKVKSLVVERYFTFHDGYDDLQRITFTVDSEAEPLVMPYEDGYFDADEQALVDAIVKTGSNYTVSYAYYDDTTRTEYYGDRVIYKDYGYDWGSSGYVYINDYAYFLDIEDGVVHVDDEPYKPYINSDLECYRAYMEKCYLPLTFVNPKDWTFDGTCYVVDGALAEDYDYEWFGTRDYVASMKLYLTDDGYVDRVEMLSSGYGADDLLSTMAITDIGTTEYQG